MIKSHAVETRRQIRIVKDGVNRLRAICTGDGLDWAGSRNCGKGEGPIVKDCVGSDSCDKGKGPLVKNVGGRGNKSNLDLYKCPRVLYVSPDKRTSSWVVRKFVNKHHCLQSITIYACTESFMADEHVEQLQDNPKIPIKEFKRSFKGSLRWVFLL
ncbi:hypothetical protein QVD17_37738 [Tagetes erecta]|uniref:Uncharacterized protein n=1 Tax=Tagetes erecta TaxID=13708 RepID=A0AAD8JYV0_TARER|nr:hypothetical protein QVD17_37738 [Tagetes erecta]